MDTDPAPVLDEPEDHDRGLQFDRSTLVGRRRLLGLLAGGVGAATLTACGLARTRGGTGSGSGVTTTTTASSGALTETPEETSGPYPGDGSNGVNVLTESGIVRATSAPASARRRPPLRACRSRSH